MVSGLPAYDVVAFYMGPAVLLALVCCLFALGNLFYRGDRDKTAAFVFGLFLFTAPACSRRCSGWPLGFLELQS